MSLHIYVTSSIEEISECECSCSGNQHITKSFPSIAQFNLKNNLMVMADIAGLYECLWRPEKTGIIKASQMIDCLKSGIDRLKSDPQAFMHHNPSNGWGSYKNLLETIEQYLLVCEEHPTAHISVCR